METARSRKRRNALSTSSFQRAARLAIAAIVCLAASAAAGEPPRQLSKAEYQRLRALCFRLGENEPGKKWDAARTLIREGERAVPVVGELFAGDWVEGKRMAAWILSEIHHPSAVGPLAQAMGDADEEVRWKAAVGLKRIGEPATFALVAKLLTGNLHAKHCSAWTLGELRDPAAAGALASALEEDDEDLRWKAATALAQVGAPALPALAKVFASESVETRRCAIWAVGKIGGKASLPALEKALADADNHVRAKAVVALGAIQGKQSTELLMRMVNDADKVVRKDAIVALGRRGKALKPTPRPDTTGEPTSRIPLYGVCEVAFTPEKCPPLENPFADAALAATFIAPDDRNIKVLGFYAGQGVWKVRAALDQAGRWFYRLDFRAGGHAELGHGAAQCVARKARGFLRIDGKHPTVFAFDDGSRLFPIGTGTETLGNPSDAGEPRHTLDVWKAYLGDCARARMSTCRLFLLEVPWIARAVVAAHPELSPWPLGPGGRQYDLRRFALPFWDKLGAVLAHGEELGLQFELVIFDETGLAAGDGKRWALHPFNERLGGPLGGLSGSPAFYDLSVEANRAAQEAYVRYLLARTAARTNVTYELANEMNRRGAAGRLGVRWVEHWMAALREHDPYDHLVSLSVAEGADAYYRIEGIDVANVHGAGVPPGGAVRMPVVLAAPQAATPREERALFWQALLRGAPAARAPWQPLTARTAIFEHTRYLADYAKDLPWWELRRDDAVVLSAPGGTRAVAAVRGGEIHVYVMGSADEGTVRVGVPNGRYDADWFDPKNGPLRRDEDLQPDRGALDLACPTFEEDLVLRIRKKLPPQQKP